MLGYWSVQPSGLPGGSHGGSWHRDAMSTLWGNNWVPTLSTCVVNPLANYLLACVLILVYIFVLLLSKHLSLTYYHWLSRDEWVPTYYLIIFATLITYWTANDLWRVKKQQEQRRWIQYFGSALPMIPLIFISGYLSIIVTDYIQFWPIIGEMIAIVYNWITGYLGTNLVKILQATWGFGFSFLLVFIPVIGPLIGSLLLLAPQNLLLVWLSSMILCFFE